MRIRPANPHRGNKHAQYSKGSSLRCQALGHAGLDAFAALSIMDYVAQLAAKGHTCIATIHAPRTAIWAKFHKVP